MNELMEKLESSILAGRSMHAYLLSGQDSDMTLGFARTAASLMLYSKRDTARLDSDPDYMEYGGNVSVGDFRDIIRPEIYRETFGKNGRVLVLKNADRLSVMVQNAMLKVLEEPPENTRFILTGSEFGLLLTIRSRCMVIRCSVPDTEEIVSVLSGKGADADEAKKYALMSGDLTARAVMLYEDEGFRTFRTDVINAFLSALRGAPDFKLTRQKHERLWWSEANEMLLLVCHDLMRLSVGLGSEYCPDRVSELKKVCSYFTIGDIGSIIDMLTENADRLGSNASGAAAFDRLFASVSRIGVKKFSNVKTGV